jgi:glycosyltransferase involved in cell wall biosynthesis
MSKTVLLTCSDANSLRNFRGRLIESIRAAGNDVVAVAPSFPRPIAQWCSQLGVRMETTRLNNQSLNPAADLHALGELVGIIRRHRPHVVMGYTHKPALYTAFAAKFAGVPKVTMMVTGMGFGFEPGEGLTRKIIPAITKTLFRMGCLASETVIFHNRDNLEFFLENGLLRQRDKAVVVGGSGVDLNEFPPQPLQPAEPGELTFLLIGRIVRYKGILEYARAAEALKARYPKAKFLLAGYRDSNPLAYSDEEWRFIEKNVEYLGPSEDVRSLYAKAHVYVLPSYGEGMPRTVLEAMASGRAIITTDTYGCRDTVAEGVNGHLVPIREWKPLAKAMEAFLSGESSYAKMGAASLERARALFDVEIVNRDMLAALGLDGVAAG